MYFLSTQEHAVQQADIDGSMITISRQWYEEVKDKLFQYENTGLEPNEVKSLKLLCDKGGMIYHTNGKKDSRLDYHCSCPDVSI